MLLNHRLVAFGGPQDVLTETALAQAYGDQMHVVHTENGDVIVTDTCCGGGHPPVERVLGSDGHVAGPLAEGRQHRYARGRGTARGVARLADGAVELRVHVARAAGFGDGRRHLLRAGDLRHPAGHGLLWRCAGARHSARRGACLSGRLAAGGRRVGFRRAGGHRHRRTERTGRGARGHGHRHRLCGQLRAGRSPAQHGEQLCGRPDAHSVRRRAGRLYCRTCG